MRVSPITQSTVVDMRVSDRITLERVREKNTRLLVRTRHSEQRLLSIWLHFAFSRSEILRVSSVRSVPLERNSKSSARTMCGTSVAQLCRNWNRQYKIQDIWRHTDTHWEEKQQRRPYNLDSNLYCSLTGGHTNISIRTCCHFTVKFDITIWWLLQ